MFEKYKGIYRVFISDAVEHSDWHIKQTFKELDALAITHWFIWWHLKNESFATWALLDYRTTQFIPLSYTGIQIIWIWNYLFKKRNEKDSMSYWMGKMLEESQGKH